MQSIGMTDIGISRQINQDYIFSSDTTVGILPNLYIVADGMGGHNAGDFASRFCVEHFIEIIKNHNEKPLSLLSFIEDSIRNTNEQMIVAAAKSPELMGMGTTFVLATVDENNVMKVANVGDSRLYRINRSGITQITQDHSLVAEMVKNGDISKDEARFHPKKNVVTRAISASVVVNPDMFEVPLNDEDVILLCSDGLSNMLSDSEIFETVESSRDDLKSLAEKLIAKANENGGKDNISVILFRV
ncbi:MAG: Stp1/IreP family PP2C-type Ser/Thr phosphatase [Lachnospiraceae bacterium]|nr:Stp1/IreP family PP2C-type Ser/Thr phosphatase [Lachnospiraceae bacterium]